MASASIREAIDSTLKEAFAGIKLMLWAFPITIGFYSMYNGGALGVALGTMLTFVSLFLFLGFGVTSAHNIITKKDTVLPGCNFIEIFINGAMAFVSIIPFSIIAWLLYLAAAMPFNTYGKALMEHPILTCTLAEVIGLFIVAIPLTALVLFVRRLNIIEVFHLKKYFYALFQTFLAYTTFTFRFIFFALIVFGFLFYIFYLFIGFKNSFWIYLVVLISLTYAVLLFNAIAQISDDLFTFVEKEEEEKRVNDRIRKLVEQHK